MYTNLYRESIQTAAREALAANIGEEQILQWVREVTINAVDYYPQMEAQDCPRSSP